jgi:hypothetical protein
MLEPNWPPSKGCADAASQLPRHLPLVCVVDVFLMPSPTVPYDDKLENWMLVRHVSWNEDILRDS